uniref:Family with sequence similarity 114 member A2 n=1 Tax=Petromyzon marinus TaxID=7757 RepID=S4RWG4_PETMA
EDVKEDAKEDVKEDATEEAKEGSKKDALSTADTSESPEETQAAQHATRKRPEPKPGSPSPVEPDTQPQPRQEASQGGGWGSWGSWGKSLLTSATATVSSVGHGITHVMEKAEASLGIPTPSDLSAATEASGSPAAEGQGKPVSPTGGAFGMLSKYGGMTASAITNAVQNTSKTVITGGLDALELIGKKTMDILAEGDPGFRRTKGLLHKTTTLSQVLREAKEKEEQRLSQEGAAGVIGDGKKAHYGLLFDEFQGLSHLEALEILSNESEAKVQAVTAALSGEDLDRTRLELEQIKSALALEELDEEAEATDEKGEEGQDFVNVITELLFSLHVGVTPDKLNKAREKADTWLREVGEETLKEEEEKNVEESPKQKKTVQLGAEQEIHGLCIESLAEVTARSIEQFHKAGELILHGTEQEHTALQRAHSLTRLTVVLCKELSTLSTKFTNCLSTVGAHEKSEVLNPLITSIFLEASNSTTYIQDAFALLLPILQVSHIRQDADS